MLPFAQRLCIRNENILQKYSVYMFCCRDIFYVMSLGLQIYIVKGKAMIYKIQIEKVNVVGELDKISQVRAAQKQLFLPLQTARTKPSHQHSSPLSGASAQMLLLAAIRGSGHEGSQLILRPTITEGLVCHRGQRPWTLAPHGLPQC